MCILGMRATSCCSLETQKTDANGNVKGEDNVEDLSDEEEDSSNKANEDVAAKAEDNAEDGTDKSTERTVSINCLNNREKTYPTTAKRAQRAV